MQHVSETAEYTGMCEMRNVQPVVASFWRSTRGPQRLELQRMLQNRPIKSSQVPPQNSPMRILQLYCNGISGKKEEIGLVIDPPCSMQ